jgi:hypothetical protein
MKRSAKSRELREQAGDTPDSAQLIRDFDSCVTSRGGNIFARARRAWNTRHNLWPGKSGDGRKHSRSYGEQVFPFENASDVDMPLSDLYIREDKAFLMVTYNRMRTLVRGVEVNDNAFAGRMTSLLRWQKYTQIQEGWQEAQLLADYFLSRPGGGVMAVLWERELQNGYETVTLEEVRQLALQAQERLLTDPDGVTAEIRLVAELPMLIKDPTREGEAIAAAQLFLPNLPREELKALIADLRRDGTARFVTAAVSKNRPGLRALAPNEDIFIDPEASHLQDASDIHVLDYITESDLVAGEHTKGWAKGWIDAMLDSQRGVTHHHGVLQAGQSRRRAQGQGSLSGPSRRFQIIHTFRRQTDARGVPGIYYTCWNPGVARLDAKRDTGVAWHGLLGYDHGEYPFVHFTHDISQRSIDATRSYPERIATLQQQVKTEWDGRIDRSSLATMPPLRHPNGKPPPEWGPGVQFAAREGDYAFLDVPGSDVASREVEDSIREFCDRYFGRVTPKTGDPVIPRTVRQYLADCWMNGWEQVDTQILQLDQQLMPEEFWFRVTGKSQGKSIRATRAEIQGKFDLKVTFNTEALDMEYLKLFSETFAAAISMDRNGILDPDEALQIAFDLFDPNIAERLLKPAEGASAQEAEDEALHVLPALLTGIDVPVKPGQAYALRARTLEQLLGTPGVMEKLTSDEGARERVQLRLKRLNHQVDQYTTNAFQGRQGG